MQHHGIGIAGAGMIAAAHAAAFRNHLPRFSARLAGLKLACVADPNTELAQELAGLYGFEKTVSDWKAIMNDSEIEPRRHWHGQHLVVRGIRNQR